MRPLKIIFEMDGSGVVFDPHEPVHLDALLAYVALAQAGKLTDLAEDEIPIEPELPLEKRGAGQDWIWSASVLLPADEGETIQLARRRFDAHRADLLPGRINLEAGIAKLTQTPWPLSMSRTFIAYCIGHFYALRALCSHIKYIGRERGRGKGRVNNVRIAAWDGDPIIIDGRAMRYIPHPSGFNIVRPRPPYWHPYGAVRCLSVGNLYDP